MKFIVFLKKFHYLWGRLKMEYALVRVCGYISPRQPIHSRISYLIFKNLPEGNSHKVH